MLKRIRQLFAALFFTGITLLLLDVSGRLHHYLSWMPKVQLLPALLAANFAIVAAIIVLTLLLGRIYCSVICPLGVMQDLFARLGRHARHNRYRYSKAMWGLRVCVLIVFTVLTVAGITGIAALIAPYSTYGRIATHLFQPIWTGANNILALGAETVDSYAVSEADWVFYGWVPIAVTSLTLILIGVLAWRGGRTWCNTICPVGTVLGATARFSLLKVHFDEEKCITCGKCSRNCKSSCIDFKNHSIDASRCVTCGNCISICPKDALSYGIAKKSADSSENSNGKPADQSKRQFLVGTALLAGAAMAQEEKKVDGGLAFIEDKVAPKRQTPLTPPGSLSARNMATHCTSCQLCVSECPNKVLRPSTSLDKFMQPAMGYENGYCRPECTRCSQVCPTGAIRPITPQEKSSLQIGHAVWVKKNCIPLTDGVSCGNCARHCPTGAITMIPSDPSDEQSLRIPMVNTAVCIGCGACENLCPARPLSAIYVEGHEVHREI